MINYAGNNPADYNSEIAATTQQSQGGSNGWDFGTALFNTAGQIISLIDSNGNEIPPDQVDQLQTTDDDDNTGTYILIGVVAVIVMLILVMILKKK